MEKSLPEITKNIIREMDKHVQSGKVKRFNIKVAENKVIPIDIFPGVFPILSEHSESSKSVFKGFPDLTGMQVAEVGCGSGAASIAAAFNGAEGVVAGDISEIAVQNTKHNVAQNGLSEKVHILKSDLFENFPKLKKFDFIIANLPILDAPGDKNIINDALIDTDMKLHKRLLADAKHYLKPGGIITMTHADLQSAGTDNPEEDFEILEKLFADFGYRIHKKTAIKAIGHKWVNYQITR